MTWVPPPSVRMIVPNCPVFPEVAEGDEAAGTVSAGQRVRQADVHALVPLPAMSIENWYSVIPFDAATRTVP